MSLRLPRTQSYLAGALDTEQPSILRHNDGKAAIVAGRIVSRQTINRRHRIPSVEGPSGMRRASPSRRRGLVSLARKVWVGTWESTRCKQERATSQRRRRYGTGKNNAADYHETQITGLRSGERLGGPKFRGPRQLPMTVIPLLLDFPSCILLLQLTLSSPWLPVRS